MTSQVPFTGEFSFSWSSLSSENWVRFSWCVSVAAMNDGFALRVSSWAGDIHSYHVEGVSPFPVKAGKQLRGGCGGGWSSWDGSSDHDLLLLMGSEHARCPKDLEGSMAHTRAAIFHSNHCLERRLQYQPLCLVLLGKKFYSLIIEDSWRNLMWVSWCFLCSGRRRIDTNGLKWLHGILDFYFYKQGGRFDVVSKRNCRVSEY